MTFEEYQDKMIAHAKELQGDNYTGDDWRDPFDDGISPETAVDDDMSAWD